MQFVVSTGETWGTTCFCLTVDLYSNIINSDVFWREQYIRSQRDYKIGYKLLMDYFSPLRLHNFPFFFWMYVHIFVMMKFFSKTSTKRNLSFLFVVSWKVYLPSFPTFLSWVSYCHQWSISCALELNQWLSSNYRNVSRQCFYQLSDYYYCSCVALKAGQKITVLGWLMNLLHECSKGYQLLLLLLRQCFYKPIWRLRSCICHCFIMNSCIVCPIF